MSTALGVDDRAVYFIGTEGGHGHIKIGTSRDPGARLAELQVGNPRRLVVLGRTQCGGRALEARLHAELASDRTRGEWFRDTKAVRSVIARESRSPWEEADNTVERVAGNVRAEIARRNLRPGVVALALDWPSTTFNRNLRGETSFNVNQILALAYYLKVPLAALVGEGAAA